MTKRVCFEIDSDLYQRFKSFCVSQNECVKNVLSKMIEHYLDRYIDAGVTYVKDDDKD